MSEWLKPYSYWTASGQHFPYQTIDALIAIANGTTQYGIIAQQYDYLIQPNGSDFEAINKHGQLEFGGADDAGDPTPIDGANTVNAVLEACATALDTNGGGSIALSSGLFPVAPGAASGLGFTKGVNLEAVEKIKIYGAGTSTILVSTVPKQRIFTIGDTSPNVSISDLTMDGANLDATQWPDAADALFVFTNASNYGRVERCWIVNGLNSDGGGSYQGYDCKFLNNVVIGCEHGLVATEAARCEIAGNYIIDCDTNGVLVHATNNTIDCKIHDNIIATCANNGIELSDDADYNEVYNNTVLSCNKGIVIDSSQNSVTGNKVKGNTLNGIELTANAQRNMITGGNRIFANGDHGIEELTGADFNFITDNMLKWNTGVPAIVKTGNSSTVRNNSGYKTENGGTATITSANTSIVVNHGCDFTPTYEDINVCLLNACSNDIGYWFFDTPTSTQFTIHVLNAPGASTAIFKWNIRPAYSVS